MIKRFVTLIFAVSLFACHVKKEVQPEEETAPEAVIPVTVVPVSSGPMEEVVELNATSSFQQKWIIKANLNGYVQNTNLQLNMLVRQGQPLFTLVTKEARAIGNTINKLDAGFKFSGRNVIRANGNGFVSEIFHQAGDYVQDGEQLATVTDNRSFVFLLDLPYEMRGYISGKTTVPILLPDGEKLQARIGGYLPIMDSVSQTQRILLNVSSPHLIPENLIARVQLVKKANNAALFLPDAAVLSDETQSEFWVMQLLNDSTAIKVPVKKGIQQSGNIEITEPEFPANTRVLVTGNFAMADTAKVRVVTKTNKEE